VVQPGNGRFPYRCTCMQPELPANGLVHRPNEASGIRLPGSAYRMEPSGICTGA
jgi:hypothetical protein